MIQIDIPIAFAVGQMLADAANQQLKTGKAEPYYRMLAFTNLFTGLFFAPIPVYFLVDYFGWETTYMYDPDRVTRFFIPIVLFLVILAANLGFWLSNALIRKGRDRVGRAIYTLIWIYSLGWILGNWPRSTRIGTYAQYHTAPETMARAWEVSKDPFLYILIVTLIIFAVPLVLFMWSSRRRIASEAEHTRV
jgi:ABC-type branched-subunit amino acid transport system permease subunit